MAAKVTYIDQGFKSIIQRIFGLDVKIARVGILGADASRIHPLRNTLTVGDVAMMQEYGAPRAGIPQRSYLRRTQREHRNKIFQGFVDVATQVIMQAVSPTAALGRLGSRVVGLVQAQIMTGTTPPPNAPYTVEKKGHGRTLQDTMTLHDSITYDIISAGSIDKINEAASEAEADSAS